MMSEVFVCKQLAERPNLYGEFACKQWVIYEHVGVLDSLAISKSDALLISGSIFSVFGIYVAYAVIAKAVNIL